MKPQLPYIFYRICCLIAWILIRTPIIRSLPFLNIQKIAMDPIKKCILLSLVARWPSTSWHFALVFRVNDIYLYNANMKFRTALKLKDSLNSILFLFTRRQRILSLFNDFHFKINLNLLSSAICVVHCLFYIHQQPTGILMVDGEKGRKKKQYGQTGRRAEMSNHHHVWKSHIYSKCKTFLRYFEPEHLELNWPIFVAIFHSVLTIYSRCTIQNGWSIN